MMKRIAGWIALPMLLAAGTAPAADDAVARAMKSYEKRHYREAVDTIQAELPTMAPARKSAAHLARGMAYLRTAELHRELSGTAGTVTVAYLKRLTRMGGSARSRMANLYYGEALLETGKAAAAVAPLEQFIADASVTGKEKEIAKVALGLSLFLSGDKAKAEELWATVDASHPETATSLAAAYSRARLNEKNPVALIDQGLEAARRSRSMRLIRNALDVYAREGQTEKGLTLASNADLKASSYRETSGKSKVINFYDLSLLDDLAELYLQAALTSLEQAAADPKLRDTANYYLGEAHALAGNTDQSMKAMAAFMSAPQMPPQYRDKAAARQGENEYRKGRVTDAVGTWDKLIQKQPVDPEVAAEVLNACGRLRIDCAKAAKAAAQAVETGEGRKFAVLNVGLGRYYLGRSDYGRAVTYLEAGRDKSNKNKIESNDPVMLTALAEAYYHTKKFSEALEIFFEMSKEFPEVRQVQEALQGIYSIEHKSAGDVKIF